LRIRFAQEPGWRAGRVRTTGLRRHHRGLRQGQVPVPASGQVARRLPVKRACDRTV
jgi:hypothetical protein